MEYVVPETKVEEALHIVIKIFKEAKESKKYDRNILFIIRAVGADKRGYLSITRNDKKENYYCFDIPYQNNC